MKRFVSLMLTALLILNSTNLIYATATDDNTVPATTPPNDFGAPIEVNTYEQDGMTITEKIYFVADDEGEVLSRAKSGSGWYKNEKSYTWSSGTIMTYYAQRYFVWGNGEVSVSYPTGGVNNLPSSVTIDTSQTTSGTGKYAWIFNDFAYVTYNLKVTNYIGISSSFSVTIRVSESGNLI